MFRSKFQVIYVNVFQMLTCQIWDRKQKYFNPKWELYITCPLLFWIKELCSLSQPLRSKQYITARRALFLALEIDFDRVILEGDSQVLIIALQNSSYSLSYFVFGHIVKDIQYLASYFLEIHCFHVRRYCNTITLDGRCTTKCYFCTTGWF